MFEDVISNLFQPQLGIPSFVWLLGDCVLGVIIVKALTRRRRKA